MNLGELIASQVSGYTQGYREKYIYGDNGQVAYIGLARRGATTSQPAWTVMQLTYDANNNVTDIKMAPKNSIFDNYATLSYA